MAERCPYHDEVVRSQGKTEEFQLNVISRLDKVERILIGNGSGGLIGRVARISALTGAAGGVTMIVIAVVVRYIILS